MSGPPHESLSRTPAQFGAVVLLVVSLNVLASGLVDWGRGAPTDLPLPKPFTRWHLDAGLILVVYLALHVLRRRKRLRRSTLR